MADEPHEQSRDASQDESARAPTSGASSEAEQEAAAQATDAPASDATRSAAAPAQPAAAGVAGEAETPARAQAPPPPRRLQRSRRERMLAGVGGGVAEYLDVDPVFVRIAFVLLTILGAGAGLLLYVVAWIVMPEAETVASPQVEPSTPTAPDATSEPAPPDVREGGASLGGLVLGSLLLLVGLVWMLAMLDVAVPRIDVLLAIALILVGAALLLGSLAGRHGGLIALGVVLTLVLTLTTGIDVEVDGAFGDRTEQPRTIAQIEDHYSHAFGQLTLDLRNLELPRGTTRIEAGITFGSLRVFVPEDVALRVESDVGFGSAKVLGRESSGVGADNVFQDPDYGDAERRLDLEIDAAFGSAEVRR